MKKITCILIIAMLILCGCQSNSSDDNGVSDNLNDTDVVYNESTDNANNDINENDEPTLTDRRPMICIDATLYYTANKAVSELPESATLIGSVESVASQTEIPSEQFSSNDVSAAIGSLIYADENADTIYVEKSDSGNTVYLVYVADTGDVME